ncbi:hypothetical protein NLG97_g4795 [Lecanicillium saksenae]|uniref:Uncharacterized protein n=1 Tax=Lecanicillium saksenae TaxID=468837 RepID=A0ACC1QVZ9_9HYPO|nr:hypothetical protein NLG97_g4795 [Lecanicillium saksenae]
MQDVDGSHLLFPAFPSQVGHCANGVLVVVDAVEVEDVVEDGVEDVVEDDVEDVVEDVVEVVVEDGVEDVLEDVVEDVVEVVVEDDVEDVVEDVVEVVVEDGVEDVLEDVLEDVVEDGVEDVVEDVFEDVVEDDVVDDVVGKLEVIDELVDAAELPLDEVGVEVLELVFCSAELDDWLEEPVLLVEADEETDGEEDAEPAGDGVETEVRTGDSVPEVGEDDTVMIHPIFCVADEESVRGILELIGADGDLTEGGWVSAGMR